EEVRGSRVICLKAVTHKLAAPFMQPNQADCSLRTVNNIRLDRGVAQTIGAFDQFFQPLGETCRRSAIDRLVIKADRQTRDSSRMAMCPSTTPGFSPMPPTVIQRAWEGRGIPHPAP